MDHPLSDEELDNLANEVRQKLIARFGHESVNRFFRQDLAIANQLLVETFLAVRRKLAQ